MFIVADLVSLTTFLIFPFNSGSLENGVDPDDCNHSVWEEGTETQFARKQSAIPTYCINIHGKKTRGSMGPGLLT